MNRWWLCFSSGGNLEDVMPLNPREKSGYPDTSSHTEATEVNTAAQRHLILLILEYFTQEEVSMEEILYRTLRIVREKDLAS